MPFSVAKPARSRNGADYISLEAARALIPCAGRRAPRERLLSLGLEGKIKLRRFGSRWWVSRASIDEYLAQRSAGQPENEKLAFGKAS